MAAVLLINTPCELFLGSEFLPRFIFSPPPGSFPPLQSESFSDAQQHVCMGSGKCSISHQHSTFPMWGILIRLVWRAVVIQQYKHVSACSNNVLPTLLLIESHFLCLCRSLAHPFWQTTWVFRCLWIIWKSWQCPALPKSLRSSIVFSASRVTLALPSVFPIYIIISANIEPRSLQQREIESIVKGNVILEWLIYDKNDKHCMLSIHQDKTFVMVLFRMNLI